MPRAAGFAVLTILLTSPAFTAHATTPARPSEVVCPLTGERFTFTGDYGSYTAFGKSLDFEPLVMGMLRRSPSSLPQCPGSGLPLYRTFKPDEVEKLRAMVETPAWQERRAVDSAQYLVAYTQYVLGEKQDQVAWSLLAAVWSSTEKNKAFLLGKAIETWSRIADEFRPRDHDWVVANWLRVDLHRQLGAFDQADYWLRDFESKTGSSQMPITNGMIALERRLISARNPQPAAPDLAAGR